MATVRGSRQCSSKKIGKASVAGKATSKVIIMATGQSRDRENKQSKRHGK